MSATASAIKDRKLFKETIKAVQNRQFVVGSKIQCISKYFVVSAYVVLSGVGCNTFFLISKYYP